TEEFGFITLPDEFTTGSSIMPQKRNPDVVELARGRCRQIQARVNEVTCLAGGLPSNYHRDSQLQKAPVLDALQSMQEILEISLKLVPRLKLNINRLNAACSDELYAVNEAYKKVSQGMTFRDAYAGIAKSILNNTFKTERDASPGSHIGAVDNLGMSETKAALEKSEHWLREKTDKQKHVEESIWQF
ncbi:MAG: argininosuccinate lyase, partial [Gammaproteobacteria bacterium]|nr:argininosuccinate lyase [Gammaproteobacteria bacterium]